MAPPYVERTGARVQLFLNLIVGRTEARFLPLCAAGTNATREKTRERRSSRNQARRRGALSSHDGEHSSSAAFVEKDARAPTKTKVNAHARARPNDEPTMIEDSSVIYEANVTRALTNAPLPHARILLRHAERIRDTLYIIYWRRASEISQLLRQNQSPPSYDDEGNHRSLRIGLCEPSLSFDKFRRFL